MKQLCAKYASGVVMLACTVMNSALAEDNIIVQSTTSTKNSGLYDYILPLVKQDTGVIAHVVAVGTGAAIKNAMNCDGDVLMVHSRNREDKFVAEGYAKKRHDVMYNDYVIVGPKYDPAGIAGFGDAAAAFDKIAGTTSIFVSRGDMSGTHSKEQALWQAASVKPEARSAKWYRQTGSGMGATLNIAVGMAGYTLTDRATWTSFGNKADLDILVEGDRRLYNPYGVMLVNKDKCPAVNAKAGQAFIDWLLSETGQTAISTFRVNNKQLFFVNAQR
jgi:tungstate transport system substrate-binding protein